MIQATETNHTSQKKANPTITSKMRLEEVKALIDPEYSDWTEPKLDRQTDKQNPNAAC